jgi:peptidase M28-like protein
VENRLTSWGILLFVLLVGSVCALREGPPDPLPATASQDLFSAERALVYLNVFATAPHPLGSAEHNRVRDYLVSQLTTLGVTPELQRTTGVTPRYQVAGTVENILARLKGTSGAADAVALVAHYDSVPAGPGAGDDGAGVAALLETLRALRAGPPLGNDIVFVITDGEEDGLLGASAFVGEHPWAKDVRVVVNFEARGNGGESQLFETSQSNGRLVQIFAQAAPHPSGSSLTYEIYKHMPNDTDMTVFKKAGAAGLNFAFIAHWEAYHTPLDNPQLLDRGSLQQQGENALSLARRLGSADLAQLQDTDAVYFSIPGNLFVHYSSRFLWPLAVASGVLLLGMLFYANGAWQTRFLPIFASLFLHAGILLLLALIGLGFMLGVRWLHLHTLFPEGSLDQNLFYVLGLFSLLTAVQIMLYNLLRRKIVPPAFFLGGALLMFILVLVTSKWLPGGSYLFVWPLLAGLLATAAAAFRPAYPTFLEFCILCILSLPALVLYVPLLKGFYTALGFTPTGVPLLSVAFGSLFLLLFPFLDPVLKSIGKVLPFLVVVGAFVLCGYGAKAARYSSAYPKPSLLSYALDADTDKALWTSSTNRIDPWTAQYLGTSPFRGKLADFVPDWYPIDFLQQEAPAITLAPPQAELLENSTDGATRTLRLRITTPRDARTLHVGVAQTEVLSASVNGHDLGKPSEARWRQPGHWGFEYANPPAEGIDLELRVQNSGAVTIVLVDRSSGLPSIPGAKFPPRPGDSMPIHSGDQTMVRRSFVF